MTETKKTRITAEPGKQEIFITREFDARRELVFKAHMDPALLARWYGCGKMKMSFEQFEPRTGGHYRYLQSFESKGEFMMYGSFHEVSDGRIVRTSEFSGYPGHALLETIRFEELPGHRTRVSSQQVFQSVEDRDAMVRSGVETGTRAAHEALDALLADLKK
jgi:uncharacterized protein YndB with AHSA1/START domain